MSTSESDSTVVVDGTVSDEKRDELLAFQTEYPELDFKQTMDLQSTRGKVELAKDVGAMQVRGGYIVVGVDGSGTPTSDFDAVDPNPFDEASLAQQMARYLPQPIRLHTRISQRDGHQIALICVMPNPAGCAVFHTDGKYRRDDGTEITVFRQGDVYWRDGTRSVRISQHGFEELIARRVSAEREQWLADQSELRSRERAALDAAYANRALSQGPLGAVSFDLDLDELSAAALEFVRNGDRIALLHLIRSAAPRARAHIDADEITTGLSDLLDKLIGLGATFMEYEQWEWFDRIVDALSQIYAMPLVGDDPNRFGYSTNLSPAEIGPRVWLQVVERVFGLGALAVRLQKWQVVRTLTLQLPPPLDYETTWLRHALTMSSRAHHLGEEGDPRKQVSLLSLAQADIVRLDCLRPDGVSPDSEEILTSLAQFDVLACLIAVDDNGEPHPKVFYPNFARFRQARVQALVDRLLGDESMRADLGLQDDSRLALDLTWVGESARSVGIYFNGFDGWGYTPVGTFIAEHPPNTDSE